MKTFIRLFIALYSVFHFYQCEQITSNSIEHQVEVLSGPQSLAIHNNMSVPVYYLIIEQESATRALLLFSCSEERNIAAGERKEIFYKDVQFLVQRYWFFPGNVIPVRNLMI